MIKFVLFILSISGVIQETVFLRQQIDKHPENQQLTEKLHTNLHMLRENYQLCLDETNVKNAMWWKSAIARLNTKHILFPANQLSIYTDPFEKKQKYVLSSEDVFKANLLVKIQNQKTPPQVSFQSLTQTKSLRLQKDGSAILQGGTCSACSMLYANAYLDAKRQHPTHETAALIEFALQATSKVRDGNNPELATLQAAMNTICSTEACTNVLSYAFRKQKIEALAGFKDLLVINSSPQFFLGMTSKKILDKLIKELDQGVFLFRILKARQNSKGEASGHTMVFIKESDICFFYDPNVGTIVFLQEEDLVSFIYESILGKHYNAFARELHLGIGTFYQVELPSSKSAIP